MYYSRKLSRVISCIAVLSLCFALFTYASIAESAPSETKSVFSAPAPSTLNSAGLGTRWIYEYSTGKNADFTPMVPVSDYDANYPDDIYRSTTDDVKSRVMSRWGAIIYTPGYNGSVSTNSVLAFVVPENGKLNLRETLVTRNYGLANDLDNSDVEIAIYLNNKKIWPSGNAWQSISKNTTNNGTPNQFLIPAINDLLVSKNDKLRYVVNVGDMSYFQYYDDTQIYASIELVKNCTVPDHTGITPTTYISPKLENLDTVGLQTRWTYEASTAKNTDWTPMTYLGGTYPFYIGNNTGGTDTNLEARVYAYNLNMIALHPVIFNDKSNNAVMTFIVPSNGVADINSNLIKRWYGNPTDPYADVEVAIYHNDAKIWPAGDTWQSISVDTVYNDQVNTFKVPDITDLTVKAGDRIRFVVNAGNLSYYDWGDDTVWDLNIDLYPIQTPYALAENISMNINDGVLTSIQPGTGITAFINSFVPFDLSLSVEDALGNRMMSGNIGTGTVVKFTNNQGQIVDHLTAVLYGDVSGDGNIDLNDLAIIRDCLLEVHTLENVFLTAGDLYGEGSVTLNDLVGIMAYNSESGTINQNPL